jgi:zinc-binding in reverse transcriptase
MFAPMWKARVPPIKIFFYLLLNDMLLTQQILVRRRIINSASDCLMCAQCPNESSLHLFFLCRYAISVWLLLQQNFQILTIQPNLSTALIIQNGYEKNASRASLWCRIVIAACWHIWKLRNSYCFGDISV